MSDTLNLMRNEDGDVVNVITSITQEPGSPPMIPNPISKEQNFKKWIKAKGLNMNAIIKQFAKEGYEANVEVLGILPTMVQTGTNVAEMFIEQVNTDYPDLLLPYPVPHSIKLTESQLASEPITDYDPHHPASKAYMQLAEHITKRGK